MFKKFVSFILGTPQPQKQVPAHHVSAYKRAIKERELIKKESRIGGTLFGAVPAGHTREFFVLDEYVCIWDEQWFDEKAGMMRQMHVRYEFQPRGVLKIVNGIAKGFVEGPELKNLMRAVAMYHDRVAVEVYGYAPAYS